MRDSRKVEPSFERGAPKYSRPERHHTFGRLPGLGVSLLFFEYLLLGVNIVFGENLLLCVSILRARRATLVMGVYSVYNSVFLVKPSSRRSRSFGRPVLGVAPVKRHFNAGGGGAPPA